MEQTSSSGIKFDNDSESLRAASLYTNSNDQWAVSNTGNFISNPNGPQYIVTTETQITNTLDSELYKTARISPSSLRYYGLGLENGKYNVELHFAEITMDDSQSWKGLGRRLFDIYIQVQWKKFNCKGKHSLYYEYHKVGTNKIVVKRLFEYLILQCTFNLGSTPLEQKNLVLSLFFNYRKNIKVIDTISR